LTPKLPFLTISSVIIDVIFSTILYWLGNFHPTGKAFSTWIMWLFLDLVAAESLVVLISSIFPNFVISLALTAFANGLWMSVNGFMVSPKLLNVFYRYIFHYIDYQVSRTQPLSEKDQLTYKQAYVFQGMMVNEFAGRTYSCGSACECMFQTHKVDTCSFSGLAVLDQYGYNTGLTGQWAGILLAIVLGYRLLGWAILWARK
jgi:hypothetical protein